MARRFEIGRQTKPRHKRWHEGSENHPTFSLIPGRRAPQVSGRMEANSGVNTPAGQRQDVLGVNIFAVEPTTVNDNLCTQEPRLETSRRDTERLRASPTSTVFRPPILRYARRLEDHLPSYQSFQSRFHLFRLRSPFKLTHSSHIAYIVPTSTVRYCGTYLCLLPLHA
ncbi:hypothetical protein BDN70DRAFT_885621 [Pholiota conissans]|uniref:Uncharacterized protein n=1 Tax=Pholiota conissans TaxID=109636 RepID=A0A9P6CNN6_9AGAR|nr:hypothetical protein BDN70DRAFT_885621 [Pholiota conissans]